jgi:hypothetical protein
MTRMAGAEARALKAETAMQTARDLYRAQPTEANKVRMDDAEHEAEEAQEAYADSDSDWDLADED